MKPIDTFLIPGRYVLEFILQDYLHSIEPTLIAVLSGMVSWFIWIGLIKAIWAVTLRMFGFEPRRRF